MNKLLLSLLLVSGTVSAGEWGNDTFFTNNEGWMSSPKTVRVAYKKPTRLEKATNQPNQEGSQPVSVTAVKESNIEYKPASEVKLLEITNPEAIARRAEAIKKPGAVVAQTSIN